MPARLLAMIACLLPFQPTWGASSSHPNIADRRIQSLPHEEIIDKLDKAGEKFSVLVLKTDLTLPYTSVFLELDCGYWSAAQEKRLREAMKAAQ